MPLNTSFTKKKKKRRANIEKFDQSPRWAARQYGLTFFNSLVHLRLVYLQIHGHEIKTDVMIKASSLVKVFFFIFRWAFWRGEGGLEEARIRTPASPDLLVRWPLELLRVVPPSLSLNSFLCTRSLKRTQGIGDKQWTNKQEHSQQSNLTTV